MLGPSILVAGPPFSMGYAFHARRQARGKFAATFGLIVAGVELLILAAFTVMGCYLMWLEMS
jgi:hypothetical protein